MYSIRVATTDDRDMPVSEEWPGLTWERLCDVLRIEISPEAAALFAEPVADPTRGLTHWHIVALEDPKPLLSLTAPEREKLLATFHKLQDDIRAYADRLAAAGGETNLRLAIGLRAAVETSDQDTQLWSASGTPLLTGWGRRKATAPLSAARIVTRTKVNELQGVRLRGRAFIPGLTRTALAQGGVAVQLTHFRGAASWLFWLPFWLIIAAIFYQLLPACAIDLPLLRDASQCVREQNAPQQDLIARNEALRRAVFEAEKRIAANCADKPKPPPQRKSETDRAPSRDETKKRADAAGLQRGRLDVTLAWNGREDLDLHVYCPGGHLYYGQKSACGGVLDQDRNASLANAEEHPVEHATWEQEPPAGMYRIVVNYLTHGLPLRPVPFTVLVRNGDQERSYPGVAEKFDVEIEVARLPR
jgi:hypothetical protein